MDSLPPASTEQEPRPLTFFAAALWSIAAVLLVAMGVSISAQIRPGAEHDLVTVAGSYAVGYSLVLFAILRVHEPQTRIRSVLAVRNPGVLTVVLAIAAGAALSPVSGAIEHLVSAKLPLQPETTEALDKLFALTSPARRATVILAMAVVIPLCQGIFLQGALFTPLERHRSVLTVVLATAAFDLLGGTHDSPLRALPIVPAVLLFAWVRGSTGSIVPAILARMAFFGFEIVPYALGRELPPAPRSMIAGCVAAVIAAAFGIHFLGKRRVNDAPDAPA